ncbi:hypothetical protein T4A_13506 [Trichinella pseudospiralis]|uniref:Uncharacterized protein n=1 Tax=Trichinella pseudospiralis TaxID=6337 RepID=A0A0V1DPA1_TRIPS|nr:hypothetical protein T4A_13506 [Trichinella pseudospiralis]
MQLIHLFYVHDDLWQSLVHAIPPPADKSILPPPP